MSEIIINGGRHLDGSIDVSGAKNSVLPLLAATFLCDSECVLHICPALSDVDVSIKILECLGCECKREGSTVIVKPSNCCNSQVPECLMREMRSSIVFMGAVAARCGAAVMSLPGGCELGPRPIDMHIDALQRLGAKFECSGGVLFCRMPEGVVGSEISLRLPSVGATENILLASVLGNGVTVIHNAAKEPEIVDLCLFLQKAGADIKGIGTDEISVNGVKKLSGVEYSVMSDRIVAATYMFAVGMCGGKIRLNNLSSRYIKPIMVCLEDCGCELSEDKNGLVVSSNSRLNAFDTFSSQPYPGFPTDAGPPLVAFATVLNGTSVFIENIFDSRFGYTDELKRLVAKIKTVGRTAIINGVKNLEGAHVKAADLRGGAALILGGLRARGQTVVGNTCYIDRGYENVEQAFSLLGADIKRL